MSKLAGRVAIVTGAGQGIGRGIALAFAKEGARVVVAEINDTTRAAVVDELKALGAEVLGVHCDVANRDNVRAVVDAAVATFGGVNILVNNAHSFGPASGGKVSASGALVGVEAQSDEVWKANMSTGLFGSLYFMQAVFPLMKERGRGRIINFGSDYGVTGKEGAVAYNCTKEAVRALSRTAANEWGPYGITVNNLVPFAATPAFLATLEREGKTAESRTAFVPLRRAGDPEADLGRVAVFLASDDASFVTSQTMFVDGGKSPRVG